jgi:DNA-directed RNA polymerase subunit alpha
MKAVSLNPVFAQRIRRRIKKWEAQGAAASDALLQTSIEEVTLSTRAQKCLKGSSIWTIGDLRNCRASEILRIKNLGGKTFAEIKRFVAKLNLSLRPEVI